MREFGLMGLKKVMSAYLGAWLSKSFAFVGFIGFLSFAIPSLFAQTYESTPVTVGFRAFNYDGGGINNEPTQEKPESKLWHHDGYWWGVLWDPAPSEHSFKIHRFDPTTQNWTIIGSEVDDRRRSAADALWDGTTLYIASRAKESHKDSEGPDTAILNRYTYHTAADSFSLDAGFPVDIIGTEKTRALTIARDSIGKIWAVWTKHDRVQVNRTTIDDQTWGTTFELPGQGNDLADIDLASIVAFGGDKIGILWSNQIDEKYYFAVHQDANADTIWDAREEALADSVISAIADDHINVACHTADGTLIAAVKTSTNGVSNPRVFVIKRNPVSGNWSRHLFGVGADDHTRPIALINSETDSVYVFARGKDDDAIVMKTAHLDSLEFEPGTGSHVIKGINDPAVNNPTSTKQCVTSESGLLVLATAKDTKYYLHSFIDFSPNSPPVAGDDSYNVDEDSTLIVAAPGILTNDNDADGDPLTASVTTPPSNGFLTLNSDGSFSYVPNAGFNGADSFVYAAYDASDSSAATVTIQVNPLNDPPVALDDAYNVQEDSSLSVAVPGVLINDNDVDGDSLTATLVTGPSNGNMTLNADGSFTYTPSADFNGPDTFVYAAHDASDSSTAIVTIQVASINDPPVATDDLYEMQADSVLNVSSPGVLVNDNDPDLGGFAAILSQGPTNGALTLNPDGSFSYIPDLGFAGTDSFLYFAEDDSGEASDPAWVTLEVSEPAEPTSLTFEPTDDVHVKSTNPDKNYRTRHYLIVEQNAFTAYLKFDVQGMSAVQSATLRLYVTATSVDGGEVFSVSNSFEGTSTPWDEESLTASNAPVISGPSLASIGQASLGTYVEMDVTQAISGGGIYSFAIWKNTSDKVEYSSKEGAQPPQLEIVFGEGQANSAPVAADDSASTVQGISVEIDVTGNDVDSNGTLDPTSIAIVSPPSNGTAVADAGSGLVSYAPDPTFVGGDSFTYTVDDDQGATSNAATVSVTVAADSNLTTFTFQPIEDGRVNLTEPSRNYGNKPSAKVDAGEFNSYFKFNVTGVSGPVQSLRLRFFVTNTSNDGGAVYSVSNSFFGTTTPWVEETLSASNAPEISGVPIGEIGVAPLDEFVEVALAPVVSGEGIYSFALSKNTSDRAEYSTKEGSYPPELIIETGTQASKRSAKSDAPDAATTDDAPAPLPTKVTLGANYPNPFNAGTTITYSLPTNMKVELKVFNTRGQHVRTLVQGLQQPGHKRVEWDARDDRGKDVSSGVYFLQLKIGSQNLTRRMILQK